MSNSSWFDSDHHCILRVCICMYVCTCDGQCAFDGTNLYEKNSHMPKYLFVIFTILNFVFPKQWNDKTVNNQQISIENHPKIEKFL